MIQEDLKHLQRSRRIWNAHSGPERFINAQNLIISNVLEKDISV
jgi:hypothetical protein